MVLSDRYTIEVPLGENDVGAVWRARDTAGGRAAVVLLEDDAPEDLRARFLADARKLLTIQHPNVARGIEVDENDGAPYLALEFIEGTSLAARLADGPPLTLGAAVSMLLKVGEGLSAAHTAGLVHGDLEPGQILLTGPIDAPVPHLIGFALNRAREHGARETASRVSLASLAVHRAYAAPEQIRGEVAASVAADLYSYAAIVYAALAGHPPHVAPEITALLESIAGGKPMPLSAVRRELSAFSSSIDRALSSVPGKRQDGVAGLNRALQTAFALAKNAHATVVPLGARSAIGKPPEPAVAIAPKAVPLPAKNPLLARTPAKAPSASTPEPKAAGPADSDAIEPPAPREPRAADDGAKGAESKAEPAQARASDGEAKQAEPPSEPGLPLDEAELQDLPEAPRRSERPPPPTIAAKPGARPPPSKVAPDIAKSDTPAPSSPSARPPPPKTASSDARAGAPLAPSSKPSARPPPPDTAKPDVPHDVASAARKPSTRPPPPPDTAKADVPDDAVSARKPSTRPPPPKPIERDDSPLSPSLSLGSSPPPAFSLADPVASPSAHSPSRSPVVFAAVAAAIVLVVGGGWFAMRAPTTEPPAPTPAAAPETASVGDLALPPSTPAMDSVATAPELEVATESATDAAADPVGPTARPTPERAPSAPGTRPRPPRPTTRDPARPGTRSERAPRRPTVVSDPGF